LSADAARSQQNDFFASLDSAVQKTPKVLAAEARGELQAERLHNTVRRDDKSSMARSAAYNSKSHEAVPKGKMSAEEDRQEQHTWFDQLDKSVKKTKRVLAAERRASREQKALKQYVASAEAQKQVALFETARQDAEALPKSKMSAKEYKREQDKYFEELSGGVKKTARVLGAERRARRESKARKLARHADDEALVDTQVQAAISAAEKVRGVPADSLSKDEAAKEQDAYFKRLDTQDHVTAGVKRSEAEAKLAALHNKERQFAEDEQEARDQARTHQAVKGRLTHAQAVDQQQDYYNLLAAHVNKTPAVLMAEKRAKAAKESLLYSGEAARKGLAGDLSSVAKSDTIRSTLASHAVRREEDAALRLKRGATTRKQHDARETPSKIDFRSEARRAVYQAHAPKLDGKLKLEWSGSQPAEKLYAHLKGQALGVKGVKGSARAATEEWDHRKSGIVDKMEQEFKNFKI